LIYDVIIVGAGASGLFLGSNLKGKKGCHFREKQQRWQKNLSKRWRQMQHHKPLYKHQKLPWRAKIYRANFKGTKL